LDSNTVSFSHWLCEEADLRSISYRYSDRRSVLGCRPCSERSEQPSTVHAGLRCLGDSPGDEIGSGAMNYLEIIADKLSKAGWSWGYVSAVDTEGRTIWIADAHRDGKRFIVRADEMLTAFLNLQRAIMRSR